MRDSQPEAAVAKPAATIVLTRDRDGTLQILLLRRSAESRFMGGSYVFPGGLVETADDDVDLWQSHADVGPDEIRRRIGGAASDEKPLAAAVAAIRETFEEAGVLLARRQGPAAGNRRTIFVRRLAGELPPDWLQQCVKEDGWIIQLSRLLRWSRWITPARMPYRFDTRFFVARMPEEQVCQPDLKETVHALWIDPAGALRENLCGRIPLSPPTLITLHQMLPFTSMQHLENAAAKRHWGSALQPRMISDDSQTIILEPWDPEYRMSPVRIDLAALRAGIVPVGHPFSRLWFSDGVWKPIKIE